MLAELAQSVRDGRISAVELIEESLRRIEAAADLNAVVRVEADQALAAAEAHDRQGALAGIPLLVKDLSRAAGSVTTNGSRLYAGAEPDEVDDITVARLRAAGAIVVGRTNSPEFGHTLFTHNELHGTTFNPWNHEFSPGGSSGGSAAALIAGLAPMATTSDGGGSVRIPAAACGLLGMKPTMGVVGRNHLPRWIEFSTQGATGRSVADVLLELQVIAGPAPGDWTSVPLGTARLDPERPARVLACRTFRRDVDPTVEAAYERSLDALAADGFTVERVDAPSSPVDAVSWFIAATAELAQSLADRRDEWDLLDGTTRELVEVGSAMTAAQYLEAQRNRHALGARIDELVGDDAVLALPTLNVQGWAPTGPAPWAAGSVTDDPTIAANTPEINASGHPAASIPMGLGDDGVPMGLQIVAPRFRDGLALGVAAALERVQPWPTVAPGYSPFPVPAV
jgi:Asp-tRNA(Asn)/Glu-tRNA(Gln) amidotransferase A subunit family amidase